MPTVSDRNNLREKRFILVSCFRVFSSIQRGRIGSKHYITVNQPGSRVAEARAQALSVKRLTPRDLLLSARLFLLKALLAGGNAFRTGACG